MAASSSSSTLKSLLLLCSILFSRAQYSSPRTTTRSPSPDSHLSSIRSLCKSTPYPDVCFDTLKLSISINISPNNIITYLLHSLQAALSEAESLSAQLSHVGPSNLVEKQRGIVQDCKDLHQITMSCLKKSMSRVSSSSSAESTRQTQQADARAFLSAALTNKNTCLEGLDFASGPLKPNLVNSFISTYKHVSNSLSILSSKSTKGGHNKRRLLGFPRWVSRRDRRILESSGGELPAGKVVLEVAADGSGNFTTISDAINFAPNNSEGRVIIHVREGVYEENVEIPSYKTNVVLLGDGSDVTVVTGNRSVVDGWTTFRSATVAVSADGFLARDIAFENTAGPAKHQAVALRVNADQAAVYKCAINGYQDTLYVHSFRQFYRECQISGTIDFIFGNAAAVFQGCDIVSRRPMPGQFTAVTAQSRDMPEEDTGISVQNCSVTASEDLYSGSGPVKSYLGRPWRLYSRVVFIESYIDGFMDPEGWVKWSGGDCDDQGLDKLYYGEYENSGPGSDTENRVAWEGYHVMDYYDAYNFTVSQLITGDEWLDSTSFPYDDGI